MLSDGNSTYHALQLSVNNKLTHGLTVLANYTWSKMLDDGSGDRDNSGYGINKDRPDIVGDWRISGDRSKGAIIDQAFNTAVFRQNGPGTFGTAGRNILRGEFRQNLDCGVIKSFPITERHKLQFRAEALNLLNHASLGAGDGNQSAPNFGRITTPSSPRVIQVALKYMF